MPRIVTLGEIMLRLSPPGFTRFVQAQSFEATYGGAEANVAVALAQFGMESTFITKLPAHEIGQSAVNQLRRFGVGDEYIVRGGDRLGLYFLETGASQRASKVIYDRANAAITTCAPEEIDFDAAMEGAAWFHWTGITPALGEGPRRLLVTACQAARRAGATVSCDLNFRAKLWTMEEAQASMNPLMEYVDVCIANPEDARKCLGFTVGATGSEDLAARVEAYGDLARAMKTHYGFERVAGTLRESFSASDHGWSAVLHDEAECAEPYQSRRYVLRLVDRVGGGDSFASGLIAGLLTKASSTDALEFAVAASALKQTIPGDANLVSYDEVDALWQGSGEGRVER